MNNVNGYDRVQKILISQQTFKLTPGIVVRGNQTVMQWKPLQ